MAIKPLYPWQGETLERLEQFRHRLPNALLVYGPSGIGTFELIQAWAKSLLCENPGPTGEPCGQCRGCQLARAGTHPDLKIIVSEFLANAYDLPYTAPDKDSTRKTLSREILIHQIRVLTDFINMVSHQGGRRVVIIYPVDKLRSEAAASLLKSIEEPPEGLSFILVSDNIDGVLPTIRSRSQLLRVKPVETDVALAWLKAERIKNAEHRLALSGGAPLKVEEDLLGEELEEKSEKLILGVLKKGPRLDATEIVSFYTKDLTVPAFSLMLSRWAADLIFVKMGQTPRFFIDEEGPLKALVQSTTIEKLFNWQAEVNGIRQAKEHPLSARIVLEAILLRYRMIW